jgi:feruloyl esterase
MRKLMLFSFLFALIGLSQTTALGQKSCDSLTQLALPNTKITLAQSIAAGAFTLPMAPGARQPNFKDLPAFCRVVAEIMPTADSDIKIEVWIPETGWNHKYEGQGNGGFAGVIDYSGMAAAIKRGYATAGTDTGHASAGAAWALGHPEKVIDFGYRGIHEMTLKAKLIIQAFAGEKPQQSYFASCSDGGREALMEAQRFPEDYDGIIAGAPANYWTHLLAAGMWGQVIALGQDSYIPASKLPAITAAVLAACDKLDGVADGILNDPRQCHFDPAALVCKGADANDCLTAKQVIALKNAYAGPRDAAGRQFFPAYMPGGEYGAGAWSTWITGTAPGRSAGFFFGNGFFANMVYEKADWDFKTFNLEEATKLADAKTAVALNSIDPNLKSFMARGGKLIMFHGWNDPGIPPENTINYYQSVVTKMGQRNAESFMKLFMVPGMQHCGGGPGPNAFGNTGAAIPADPEHNIFMALERWVEKGVAPAQIIGTKFVSDNNPTQGIKLTRPLCAYPKVAQYKGSGDPNDAANFVCAPGMK